jgi:hypothetical protein
MVLFVILVVVWSIALLKGDGSAKKPANLPMDQAGP